MDSLQRFQGMTARLRPETVAVVGSLLLSLVAFLDDNVINRDGMLYVSVARQTLEQGPSAALEMFNWPFLPMMLAGLGWLTGIDPAPLAMAFSVGTLMLLSLMAVKVSRLLDNRFAWPAVLFVLGAPVFNEYRADLLRDTGAWMAMLCAIYCLLCWLRNPGWKSAGAFQAFIALAVLFRPEMAFLVLAVPIWLLFARGPAALFRDGFRLLGILGIAGLVPVAMLFFSDELSGRAGQIVDVLSPETRLQAFSDASEKLGGAVLNKYSEDEAGQILFWGLLTLIPGKWLQLTGLFVLPVLYAWYSRCRFADRGLFVSLNGTFALVLAVFVTWSFYLASRHVAPLALLSMPWVCLGLLALAQRFPAKGWRRLAVALTAISALSGVISTGPGKGYLREAGEWLAAHPQLLEQRVFISDQQITFYATGQYPSDETSQSVADVLASPAGWQVLVLEGEALEARLSAWLEKNAWRLERHIEGDDGEAVWILTREGAQRGP